LNELLTKIYQVIIEGNRYKLLINGLGVTLQVTFFAALFGLVLGLILAFMRLNDKAEGIFRLPYILSSSYIDIIRGTPSMLQLLIIYHVVFGGVKNIPAIVVAIIAFSINSSAYVAEIFRGGILAVSQGQTEAGISLGLTKFQTMRHIVFPQALKNAFPPLTNEVIVLMKETAIVGYVALQDLTKAGDFIISRTYNAWIPLFTVAIIYFSIIKILTKVFSSMERRLRKSDLR